MGKKRFVFSVSVSVCAVSLNLLGAWAARAFDLPLYLDSIATIAVAFFCGLLPSLAVATVTNFAMIFAFDAPPIFITCHLMTSLGAWMIFNFTEKQKPQIENPQNDFSAALPKPQSEFFLLSGLLSAITNGVLGSIYSIVMFQGEQSTPIEGFSNCLYYITNNLSLSLFWSGIVTNLADKTLSAMISFVIVIVVLKIVSAMEKEESQSAKMPSSQPVIPSIFATKFLAGEDSHNKRTIQGRFSYLITSVLVFIAIANIVSCMLLQKSYRTISGTTPPLESSLYMLILSSIVLLAASLFIAYAKIIQVQKEKELEDKQREWHQKVAFDLHDGVLQNFVALKSRLETKLKETDIAPEIQLIQSAVSELRLLCGILWLDDKIPFEESIHHTLDAYERTYRFKSELIIGTDLSVLDINQKEEILRILYECLSNSAIHSDAKNVSVSFADDGNGKLYFTVRDDGTATETKKTDAFHGLGLKSIKNRVKNLGGKVEFLQTPDGWTTRIVIG